MLHPWEREFLSQRRKWTRAYWMLHVSNQNFVSGDILIVRSDTRGVGGHSCFDEELEFSYIDNFHINGKTPTGVSVGLPTCYVINITKKET